METAASFTARRGVHQTLPHFQLPPPPNQEIPSMHRNPHHFPPAPSAPQPPAAHPPPPTPTNAGSSILTMPPGGADGISPLSSVNTGSSQSSQTTSGLQQYYSGNVHHGSWPTPGNSSYTYSSAQSQGPLAAPPPYASRANAYDQSPSMPYPGSRSSQSPATGGEGLPPPPYGQVHHQPFQTAYSQGGAGSNSASLPSQAPPAPQGSILSSQTPVSTQPPTPSSATAHVDPYSRPPPTPSYYSSSTPQQSNFPPFHHPQHSPTAPSPTTSSGPARGLHSIANQSSGMAPPQPYRGYPYHQVPSMPIMSNLNNPSGQMSLVPGMNVGAGFHGGHHHMGHPGMYGHGHGQPNPQTERPFKCDQCQQSFNRNHDLKRHKRIHLAVKPFPCNYCDKSFSRKDALKRHRLVKGCGTGKNDGDGSNANDGSNNSPPGRSEALSDGTSESPVITKREQ